MTRWVRTTVEMLDHEILQGPYDRRSAWLWLIAHAAWKDKRVSHKGRPLELKRGQVLVGRAFLAETWGWSEQNVRTFIHLLVADGMVILNQSGGHFANVLTICNYDKYQSANDDSQPVDQPEPNQSLTSVQPEPNQTLTISTKDITTTSINTESLPVAREKSRGSRLAADWVLPKSWGVWARTNFPQSTDDRVRREADKFRDYWHAKAGKDARKTNWEATWRNWVRTAFEARNDYAKGPATMSPPATVIHISEAQKQRDLERWAMEQNLIPTAGSA